MSFTLRKVANLECVASRAIALLVLSHSRLPESESLFERLITPKILPPFSGYQGSRSPSLMLGLQRHVRCDWLDRGYSKGLREVFYAHPQLQGEIQQILHFLQLPGLRETSTSPESSKVELPFVLSTHRGRVDFQKLATDLYVLLRTEEEIPWWLVFCAFLALELPSYFPQGLGDRVERLKNDGVVLKLAPGLPRNIITPYYTTKDRALFPGEKWTSLCAALKRQDASDRLAVLSLIQRYWGGDVPVVPPPLYITEPAHIQALSILRSPFGVHSRVFLDFCEAVQSQEIQSPSVLLLQRVHKNMTTFVERIFRGSESLVAWGSFRDSLERSAPVASSSMETVQVAQQLLDLTDLVYATWSGIEPVVSPDLIQQLRNFVSGSLDTGATTHDLGS